MDKLLSCSGAERVALIGCGAASEILYASALDKLSSDCVIDVAALVDPNPERYLGDRQEISSGTSSLERGLNVSGNSPGSGDHCNATPVPCGPCGKVSGKRVSCPLRKAHGDNNCRLRPNDCCCGEGQAHIGRWTLSSVFSIQYRRLRVYWIMDCSAQ